MKRIFACLIICFICINIFNCSEVMAKDKTVPTILNSNPKNNDVLSPGNNNIKITFSEKINKGSTFSKIILKNSSSKAVPFTCSLKGNTLNIVPKAKLEINKYILEIPEKAVKDQSGNYLKNKYVLAFTIKSNQADNKPSEPAPAPEPTQTPEPKPASTPEPTQTSEPKPTPKVAFYSDFEPDSAGVTWDIMGDASNPLKAQVDTIVSKSGTHSIKIYGKSVSGNLKKVVSVDTTKRFELSAYVWNDVIDTQVNEDGAFIIVAQLDAQGDIIPNTQKGMNWKTKLTGTQITITDIKPVAEAVNIGIYIGLHGTGTFWVDDVTLNEYSN